MKLILRSLLLIFCVAAGCGRPASTGPLRIRVGYFPNITHSQALIGLSRGDFQKALGPDVAIEATTFNAGPSVIEALFAGHIDLAYVGPNPAINGYIQSGGQALRIVAGATSGGASFVVSAGSGIQKPEDLAGKRLATPQLGNTQDVALRGYLAAHGLKPTENGGSVQVIPTPNPQILDLMKSGGIDGAWVPEPWAARLVMEGNGRVFLDERTLWPDGNFVTAHVIAGTAFLRDHPDPVRAWLKAHVEITRWELEHPAEALAVLNAEIEKLTGKKLPEPVLTQAWDQLRPTWDPISSSLIIAARAAFQAGFLNKEPEAPPGIYDLHLLNEVLRADNLPDVP